MNAKSRRAELRVCRVRGGERAWNRFAVSLAAREVRMLQFYRKRQFTWSVGLEDKIRGNPDRRPRDLPRSLTSSLADCLQRPSTLLLLNLYPYNYLFAVVGLDRPDTMASSQATQRLLRELKDYSKSPNEALLHLGPVDEDDLLRWEAVLKGVPGSPYEGTYLATHPSSLFPLPPPFHPLPSTH